MSFHGFLEIAVFLERFRNIDLFQQGLYHLRLSVSKDSNFAQPYDCIKTSHGDPLYTLIPPAYNSPDCCFSTSSFLIRFSEEEAQLRELFVLRYEGTLSDMDALVLTAELYYSELDRDFSLDTLSRRLDEMARIKFTSVSRLTINLTNLLTGFIEPLALEFEELHKCLVLGCITCVLFDYRFRMPENGKKQSDLLNHHIAKVLVTDKLGQPKRLAGADETDKLYDEYVRPQALSHELLRSFLCDLINRYIPHANKAQYSDLPPPLSLPHYQKPGSPRATKFSQAVASHEAVEICNALMIETSYIAEQIYKLLQRLYQLLGNHPMHCLAPLLERRMDRLRNWSSCSVKRELHAVGRVPGVQETDTESFRRRFAKDQRTLNASLISHFHNNPIEPFVGDPKLSPILFEDSYYQPDAAPPPKPVEEKKANRGKHLFILVHGFHGKAFDLRLVKHVITGFSNRVVTLSSTVNEEDTERDLFDMGERLAREVKAYVTEWLPGATLAKMSFIGYSLGGLIVRAALPHLAEFSHLFHSFISFSTPHLGHVSEASLVGAGLWVLELVKKTQMIQQLTMNDQTELQRTAIYRLSQTAGLDWFKHVTFCSSFQDKYVPHDSARIELSRAMSANVRKGVSLVEMAENILGRIAPEKLTRIDTDFCENVISFDTVTGRNAHLQFVTNEHFLKLFVHQYPELFT